jgi:hypothetical protein
MTRLKQILWLALRWGGGWALAGLVVGILLMLGRAAPFAESGSNSASISTYAIWVPGTTGVAAGFGFVLGLVFASLMALTEWFGGGPVSATRFTPNLLCGAAAGALIGLFVEAKGSVFLLAFLGACSAALAVQLHRRQSS